jgi:hypothetical protein
MGDFGGSRMDLKAKLQAIEASFDQRELQNSKTINTAHAVEEILLWKREYIPGSSNGLPIADWRMRFRELFTKHGVPCLEVDIETSEASWKSEKFFEKIETLLSRELADFELDGAEYISLKIFWLGNVRGFSLDAYAHSAPASLKSFAERGMKLSSGEAGMKLSIEKVSYKGHAHHKVTLSYQGLSIKKDSRPIRREVTA